MTLLEAHLWWYLQSSGFWWLQSFRALLRFHTVFASSSDVLQLVYHFRLPSEALPLQLGVSKLIHFDFAWLIFILQTSELCSTNMWYELERFWFVESLLSWQTRDHITQNPLKNHILSEITADTKALCFWRIGQNVHNYIYNIYT